jgi:hypothetical protein
MTSPQGTSEAELAAERRTGFEPTDRYTDTGRFWRKKGSRRKPVPHLLVPKSINGLYPDWVIADLRRRIRQINEWMRPRLIKDPDKPDR